MKSFVIEPDSVREFGSKNLTIRLGNAIGKNIYFVTRYYEYNNTWEITAIPRSFHDEMTPPLKERTHRESDTVD